jgi:type VI secretion system protein ImpJ
MQTAGFEPGYIVYLLALRSLNRYVPMLFHLTDIEHVHPWIAFGLIRQLIGELSTFTDRIDSLGRLMDGTPLLPSYDHENLRGCFEEAQLLVGELLGAILIGPENIIHMARKGDFFKAQVPSESFEGRNAFYLMLTTAEKQSRVLEVMKHVAKVGSEEQLPTLIGRALPGIPLEYSLVPPPGLPTRQNAYYFKFDQGHPQWVEILKSQTICLYWQKAPKDTRAEIVVLRK